MQKKPTNRTERRVRRPSPLARLDSARTFLDLAFGA